MAEVRHRVPAAGRDRATLVEDLRTALEELEGSGDLDLVRVDVWWDDESPEVWVRTTSGPRVRYTITVDEEGFAIHVRGPFGIRLRRPDAVRRMMDRLTAD